MNKNFKKFYNKIYEKKEEKHFTPFVIKGAPTEEIKEVLKKTTWKGKKVLDVGCGTGLFSYTVAQKGAEVIGIDYSIEAIRIAKKKHKGLNLHFERLNALDIYGQYDVIVSIGVLEHTDDPLKVLRIFKKHLKSRGKIIITCPNWTNPRGYILMTLWNLFKSPITLADLHYLTPIDFMRWAKKLNMHLTWSTFDRSWGHGEVMIKDLRRRLPKVLSDSKLPNNHKNIEEFIHWLKKNILVFDYSLPHSGALGIYVFSSTKKLLDK